MDDRDVTLQTIGEHIEEVYTCGGMWITEIGAPADPNRVYVLILPAAIGKAIADGLHEQWEESGGKVLDLRSAEYQ